MTWVERSQSHAIVLIVGLTLAACSNSPETETDRLATPLRHAPVALRLAGPRQVLQHPVRSVIRPPSSSPTTPRWTG